MSKYLKSHPNRNTLVIGAGGELDDEFRSGPLLGIVERTEPADDPDAVLAGRRLLLLGHGGGGGEVEGVGGEEVRTAEVNRGPVSNLGPSSSPLHST
jgi:hypothetical protein